MNRSLQNRLLFFLCSVLSYHFVFTYSFEKISIFTALDIYHGPRRVFNSLITGLAKKNIAFNYNPSSIKDVGDVCIVLSDIDALQQTIDWKKEGKIKRLIAGPNLVNRAHDYNYIITSPEIDTYVQACEWAKKSLEDDDSRLIGKIKVWYGGIDPDIWKPTTNDNTGSPNVLIYWKTENKNFYKKVEMTIKKHGWNPILIRYGSYNSSDYKNKLSQCCFAVFISVSETQGIALAEAWSMNVPTLVWNPGERPAKYGKVFSPVSSCPYLTEQTGVEWKTIEELDFLLHTLDKHWSIFSPRTWILEHMTDEISAQLMLNIIETTF